MPHIVLHGSDINKNIQFLDIDVTVRFNTPYYMSVKADQKLREIQEDLEAVMKKYFDDYSSDRFLRDKSYHHAKRDW